MGTEVAFELNYFDVLTLINSRNVQSIPNIMWREKDKKLTRPTSSDS